MRAFMRRVGPPIVILLLIQVAFAQDPDPGKPSTWFLTAGGWGVMVIAIVQLIKTKFLPRLEGAATLFVSALVSIGGAFLASTGWFSFIGIHLMGTTPEVFTFGLTAFITASGGWDTGVGIVKSARKP